MLKLWNWQLGGNRAFADDRHSVHSAHQTTVACMEVDRQIHIIMVCYSYRYVCLQKRLVLVLIVALFSIPFRAWAFKPTLDYFLGCETDLPPKCLVFLDTLWQVAID